MKHSVSSGRRLNRRGRKGGAAVELAVVFPVLLLLLVGVIDYGRVFYTSITVANAARAGAEFGARDIANVAQTDSMKIFAQDDGNEAGTLTLTSRYYCRCGTTVVDPPCDLCTGGVVPDVFVEVTAAKTVAFLLPYPGLPDSFSISRKATFRTQ